MLAWLPSGIAAAAPAQAKKKSRPLPRVGEFVRFADPTTETPVVRLTSIASANILPAPTNRFVSVKERFLIFASNRTGRFTPFRADLRTGVLTPICEAASLNPRSLCLTANERTLYFLDGRDLRAVNLAGNADERTIQSNV